jgi:hypothetical protein
MWVSRKNSKAPKDMLSPLACALPHMSEPTTSKAEQRESKQYAQRRMAGMKFLSRSQHIAETAMRRYNKPLMDEAARMSREEEQGLESVALAVE